MVGQGIAGHAGFTRSAAGSGGNGQTGGGLAKCAGDGAKWGEVCDTLVCGLDEEDVGGVPEGRVPDDSSGPGCYEDGETQAECNNGPFGNVTATLETGGCEAPKDTGESDGAGSGRPALHNSIKGGQCKQDKEEETDLCELPHHFGSGSREAAAPAGDGKRGASERFRQIECLDDDDDDEDRLDERLDGGKSKGETAGSTVHAAMEASHDRPGLLSSVDSGRESRGIPMAEAITGLDGGHEGIGCWVRAAGAGYTGRVWRS